MRHTIAMFGDIHGAAGGVARVVTHLMADPPDLVVLVGELGSDLLWNDFEPRHKVARWQDSIDKILEELEPLGAPVALVPGNHDNPAPAVRGQAQDVDGRIVELRGLRVAGIGGAGPARFGLPYEWDEAGLRKRLQERGWFDERVDLLLCHAPPVNCLASTCAAPPERSIQATTGPPAVSMIAAWSAAPVPLMPPPSEEPSATQAPRPPLAAGSKRATK